MKFSLKSKIRVVALIIIYTGTFTGLSWADRSCENFVAKEIDLKNNNGIEDVRYWENLLNFELAVDNGNHPNTAILLNNVGVAYCNLQDEESIQKGIKYLEQSLNMHQELFKGEENTPTSLVNLEKAFQLYEKLFYDPDIDIAIYIANWLNKIGVAYYNLHGQKFLDCKYIQKSVWYLESSLKMYLNIYDGKHFTISDSLYNLAFAYARLGDLDKSSECMNQAYSIYINMCQGDCNSVKRAKPTIELIQLPNSTKNKSKQLPEEDEYSTENKKGVKYRWVISVRGKPNTELIMLKQKFKFVLDNVIEAVDSYGWSYIGYSYNDWGVRGYIEKNYLNSVWKTFDAIVATLGNLDNRVEFREYVEILALQSMRTEKGSWRMNNAIGSLFAVNDNSKDIELVQMLCFESMNLGIMKSENKPYEVVEEFTRAHTKLVKKIAVEHPEFFVDGSIVEACISAIQDDKSFESHILTHVKYMGMEIRRERRESG